MRVFPILRDSVEIVVCVAVEEGGTVGNARVGVWVDWWCCGHFGDSRVGLVWFGRGRRFCFAVHGVNRAHGAERAVWYEIFRWFGMMFAVCDESLMIDGDLGAEVRGWHQQHQQQQEHITRTTTTRGLPSLLQLLHRCSETPSHQIIIARQQYFGIAEALSYVNLFYPHIPRSDSIFLVAIECIYSIISTVMLLFSRQGERNDIAGMFEPIADVPKCEG